MSKRQIKQPQKRLGRDVIAVWVGMIALVVAAGAYWFYQQSQAPAATSTMPAEISVLEAKGERDQGAFILDVRTQEEWDAGHIPDATLIPLDQLQARAAEVPQDQRVVIVCRSGNRSAQARDILKQSGWTLVTSMAGGLNQWAAAGYDIVTGP